MPTMDKLRSGIRQYQTTTGRRIDPKILQALLQAELEAEKNIQATNRELELRERERQDRADAAAASGKIQALGTAVTGAYLLKDTKIGQAISKPIISAVERGAGKLGGIFAGTDAAPPAVTAIGQTIATPQPGAAALGPIAQGATPGGMATAGAAGVGAGLAIGQTMAIPQPGAAALGPIAQGTAPGGMAASAAAPSFMSQAGSLALPALGGAGLGSLGANLLFPGSSTAEDIGTIGGGAVAGWMLGAKAGSVGGPVGALVGGIIGVGVDLVEDASVICTELNRQGKLDEYIWHLDCIHGRYDLGEQVLAGYHVWGRPLARKMRTSPLLTAIVRPLATAWAYEMASRVDKRIKGNLLGKIMLKVGVPICRYIGAFKTEELCHG